MEKKIDILRTDQLTPKAIYGWQQFFGEYLGSDYFEPLKFHIAHIIDLPVEVSTQLPYVIFLEDVEGFITYTRGNFATLEEATCRFEYLIADWESIHEEHKKMGL